MGAERPDPRALVQDALAGLEAARAAVTRLSTALEAVVQRPLQPADWRAAHRPGRPPRIENDHELRAFILARIDRLTFDQVVSEVAAAFPPERRTSRSALHRWWHRHGKRAVAQPGKTT